MQTRRKAHTRSTRSGRTNVRETTVRRGKSEGNKKKDDSIRKGKESKDPRKRAAAGAAEGGEKGYKGSKGKDKKGIAKETTKGATSGAIDAA